MRRLPALIPLEPDDWEPLARQHRVRAEAMTEGHRGRRRRGEKHPVEDFLFDYYSYEPAKLARWHPGAGRVLRGPAAADYLRLGAYRTYAEGIGADLDRLAKRRDGLAWSLDLMRRTQDRPAKLDCFGLHEWAMVYQIPQTEYRHPDLALRLGSAGTDDVVESHQLRCTHFDAFRFFTEPARPLNAVRPTRATQPATDQPGCLHAGMDLYRFAYKLAPYGDSALLLDAFALAREIRELDMRASPYDLAELGYAPVRIETPEGKAEYVRAQREFSERAAPLRSRLIADYERVLALTPDPTTPT